MATAFVAGQRVTAAELNTATAEGAWTTGFVPTWTQSGATPSLGNGTVVTGYTTVGRVCVGRYLFNFGSTTNFGSGGNPWLFSLPLSPNLPASNLWCIGAWGAAITNFYTGMAYLNTSGVMGLIVNGSANSVETTNPASWASSSYLFINFTYETAS